MPSNTQPKIVVIGEGGYLGERIREHFGPDTIITMDDITNLEVIGASVAAWQPDIVINAAALTNTNEIEKPENRAAAYAVNVQGPANLAYLARKHGFYLVHLSTGMMFDGAGPEGDGWKETDLPIPASYYAWTKAFADAQLLPFSTDPGTLILRLHMPLSRRSHPRNMLQKFQQFAKGTDGQQTMTIVEDLIESLDALVRQRTTGVYHVVNPGTISVFEILTLLQKHGLIAADVQLEEVSQADYNKGVAEKGGAYQSTPILNTKKLQEAGIHLKDIHQAIEDCIQELKKVS